MLNTNTNTNSGFDDLGLHPVILNSLKKSAYTEPTPVQRQAIPAALAGGDLLVSSHTGSGKTAAFMLPSLNRLTVESPVKGNGPRILVLTPTRELALQVDKASFSYGHKLKRLRIACLVGGMPYPVQLKALQGPVDVVVATPGRLMDHMERGRIDFRRLEVLILDEADRMLDMGFIDDIEAIVAKTPVSRQTLLFSATLDGVVGAMAKKITREPRRVQIAATAERRAHIEERFMFSDNMTHKNKLLDALLRDTDIQQALVFTATKRSADDLSGLLREQGFSAQALHGDMNQGQRNRTLKGLRDGRTRVLVATDVAARGIDVAGISHVINFDAPRQAEDYVHRIGRTGRAGRTGFAVTLINPGERGLLRSIERFTGQRARIDAIAGLEPTVSEPRRPHPARRGARPGGHARMGAGGGGTTANAAQPFRGFKPGGFSNAGKSLRGSPKRAGHDTRASR
ncbi:MAG: DEAD/DEAH box helicase [Burkholderiales bacterium]|nr:DEAD/DEAH box helicase [Burkholderiales bacterium]